MKAADALVAATHYGEHSSQEQREKGDPIVYFTDGALVGGLYGGLAEYSSPVRYGLVLCTSPRCSLVATSLHCPRCTCPNRLRTTRPRPISAPYLTLGVWRLDGTGAAHNACHSVAGDTLGDSESDDC